MLTEFQCQEYVEDLGEVEIYDTLVIVGNQAVTRFEVELWAAARSGDKKAFRNAFEKTAKYYHEA